MRDQIKRILRQDLQVLDCGALPLMGQTARVVRAGYAFDLYHTHVGMVVKHPEDGQVLAVVKHGTDLTNWLLDNTREACDGEVRYDG